MEAYDRDGAEMFAHHWSSWEKGERLDELFALKPLQRQISPPPGPIEFPKWWGDDDYLTDCDTWSDGIRAIDEYDWDKQVGGEPITGAVTSKLADADKSFLKQSKNSEVRKPSLDLTVWTTNPLPDTPVSVPTSPRRSPSAPAVGNDTIVDILRPLSAPETQDMFGQESQAAKTGGHEAAEKEEGDMTSSHIGIPLPATELYTASPSPALSMPGLNRNNTPEHGMEKKAEMETEETTFPITTSFTSATSPYILSPMTGQNEMTRDIRDTTDTASGDDNQIGFNRTAASSGRTASPTAPSNNIPPSRKLVHIGKEYDMSIAASPEETRGTDANEMASRDAALPTPAKPHPASLETRSIIATQDEYKVPESSWEHHSKDVVDEVASPSIALRTPGVRSHVASPPRETRRTEQAESYTTDVALNDDGTINVNEGVPYAIRTPTSAFAPLPAPHSDNLCRMGREGKSSMEANSGLSSDVVAMGISRGITFPTLAQSQFTTEAAADALTALLTQGLRKDLHVENLVDVDTSVQALTPHGFTDPEPVSYLKEHLNDNLSVAELLRQSTSPEVAAEDPVDGMTGSSTRSPILDKPEAVRNSSNIDSTSISILLAEDQGPASPTRVSAQPGDAAMPAEMQSDFLPSTARMAARSLSAYEPTGIDTVSYASIPFGNHGLAEEQHVASRVGVLPQRSVPAFEDEERSTITAPPKNSELSATPASARGENEDEIMQKHIRQSEDAEQADLRELEEGGCNFLSGIEEAAAGAGTDSHENNESIPYDDRYRLGVSFSGAPRHDDEQDSRESIAQNSLPDLREIMSASPPTKKSDAADGTGPAFVAKNTSNGQVLSLSENAAVGTSPMSVDVFPSVFRRQNTISVNSEHIRPASPQVERGDAHLESGPSTVGEDTTEVVTVRHKDAAAPGPVTTGEIQENQGVGSPVISSSPLGLPILRQAQKDGTSGSASHIAGKGNIGIKVTPHSPMNELPSSRVRLSAPDSVYETDSGDANSPNNPLTPNEVDTLSLWHIQKCATDATKRCLGTITHHRPVEATNQERQTERMLPSTQSGAPAEPTLNDLSSHVMHDREHYRELTAAASMLQLSREVVLQSVARHERFHEASSPRTESESYPSLVVQPSHTSQLGMVNTRQEVGAEGKTQATRDEALAELLSDLSDAPEELERPDSLHRPGPSQAQVEIGDHQPGYQQQQDIQIPRNTNMSQIPTRAAVPETIPIASAVLPTTPLSSTATSNPKPKSRSKLPIKRTYSSRAKNPSSSKKKDKDFKPAASSSEDDQPASKRRKGGKRGPAAAKGRGKGKKGASIDSTKHQDDTEEENAEDEEETGQDGAMEAERALTPAEAEAVSPTTKPLISTHSDTSRALRMSSRRTTPAAGPTTSTSNPAPTLPRLPPGNPVPTLGPHSVFTSADLQPRYGKRTTRADTRQEHQQHKQAADSPEETPKSLAPLQPKTPASSQTKGKVQASSATKPLVTGTNTKRKAKEPGSKAGKGAAQSPPPKRQTRRVSAAEEKEKNIGKRLRSGDMK